MIVQLQEEDENTCVSCSAINALRHFGLEAPPVENVAVALMLPRRGPNGGSYVNKAAKWLAREHGMELRVSRSRFRITDATRAASEAAERWAALLAQGYVGLLHRKSSGRFGHAVVLYQVRQVDDEWLLSTYDSAARRNRGYRTYRAIDWVWYVLGYPMSGWIGMENKPSDVKPEITGRVAWFVRPYRYPRHNGANGPPA